jgi:hypothetical protein
MKGQFILTLFLLFVCLVGESFSQKAKPDFSGNWNLDEKKTTQYLSNKAIISYGGLDLVKCSKKWLIEHNEPELIIRSTSTCTEANKPANTIENISRYFTDGRGEVNNTIRDETIESKTKWDDNKIIITIYEINPKSGKKKTSWVKEISISKNGQELSEREAFNESELYSGTFTKRIFRILK